MRRRTRAGGSAVKTRRRKTVAPKRRSALKAVRHGRSSAAGQEAEVIRLGRERDEALEQLSATSEVLRIISSSPGELEPVFRTMLENAVRLCDAKFGILYLHEGGELRLAAAHNIPSAFAETRGCSVFRPVSEGVLGRVLRTKRSVQIDDLAGIRPYAERHPRIVASVEVAGVRTALGVPMLKEDDLVGVINIFRQEVRPFTDKQIALVQNFAAQAVIAIENARLLSELLESLEQQTATSEVLKVISSSPGALKPVFQAMLDNAARACEAKFGNIFRLDGETIRTVASLAEPPALSEFFKGGPHRPHEDDPIMRVARTKQSVHVVDFTTERAYIERNPLAIAGAELGGIRTLLVVPMLKGSEFIGAIALYRQEVRPFTEKQVDLVTNFAAQAVIAIENARLLNELRQRTDDLTESLEQQTATSKVLEVISRAAFDLNAVFATVAESSVRLCGADRAFIFRYDGELLRMVAAHNSPQSFVDWVAAHPIIPGRHSGSARAALERRTVHIADVRADPDYTYGAKDAEAIRTVLGVPILKGDDLLGVMMIYRLEVKPFTDQQIALVETFADQAAIAIENVRLFDEIQAKSRELEIASRHKSQFLANMSHELRTPLNAILGYTELILDNIYGETSDKMRTVMERVQSNGKHLLGLINDVLDMSKIEAGQLALSLADYSFQDMVQGVSVTVEPLASSKKLGFKVEVAPDLPPGHGDERRLSQVLLNLVGNAIKFTNAGEVAIKVDASDGAFTVAVRDTGPGISAADQAKLFQEFQQADNTITRQKGGTGLGLAISKRIVEMHGGRIWIDSAVGEGSTFLFTIPIRVGQQAGAA